LQLCQIGWLSRRQGQGFGRLPHLLNKVLKPSWSSWGRDHQHFDWCCPFHLERMSDASWQG
jgi:hypothetical protein